jgi:hypothetical protein
MSIKLPVIKVVGISASGKSTLVKQLRNAGYDARPVSQEHSHIPTLWQQFDRPSLLICLEVDLAAQRQRRPDVSWDETAIAVEQTRLADAREHADLAINTTNLDAAAVFKLVLAYLESRGTRHAEQPLPMITATGSALTPQPAIVATPETTLVGESKREKKKRRNLVSAQDEA